MRIVLALVCSLAVSSVSAQAAAPPGGAISGVITAADDARLPGASLTLVHLSSGTETRLVTGETGEFRVRGLPEGRYVLRAELDGFEARSVPDLDVAEGQSLTVTVRLDVATVRERVRVVGAAPPEGVEPSGIRESRARDVGEALAAAAGAGVTRLRKGAIASDVVLRGFQGKDVTLLIDGQRIDGACPGHMDPPAFHVDLAEVHRVEVSKGPFDVRNQGGLAGAINVVTQRPQRGWHATANVTAGTADTRALAAATSLGQETWTGLAGASTRRADPYRDGRGALLIEGANYLAAARAQPAYDAWTAWGRVALVPRPGATLQVAYTRQDAGTVLYPYLQMDALSDRAHRASARLEIARWPGQGTFAAHGYATRVDHWMTDEFRATASGVPRPYSMATRAKTAIDGGRVEIVHGGVTAGAEASRRRWDSRTLLAGRRYEPQAPLPAAVIDVAGLFADYAADLGPDWRLEAGARVDRAASDVDRSLAHTALYLAYHGTERTRAVDVLPVGFGRATWRHARGWRVTLGAGHAARLPDQQERYYALQRAGSDWVGNPALVPSRNTGFDGEVRYASGGVSVSASAYAYRIDDHLVPAERARITAVPGVANPAARSYANVDALVRGLEVTASAAIGRVAFLSGDVSALRGTTRGKSPRGDLPEMPQARARLRLRIDDGRWSGVVEAVGAAAQRHVATALRELPTPAFATLAVRGGYRSRRIEFTIGIDNLLDAWYAEHLSYLRDPFRSGSRVHEPGRTVSASLSARF